MKKKSKTKVTKVKADPNAKKTENVLTDADLSQISGGMMPRGRMLGNTNNDDDPLTGTESGDA